MPQLNFNALASEGPQGVYQGFMQGQQLRNKMIADQQAQQAAQQQQQFNALKMQGYQEDRAKQIRTEKAAMFKEGLLRAATPEAARTLIKRQYSDPDLGPFLQQSIPLEDALAEISDDPKLFQKYQMQEALGMPEYIKSQQPKVTPTGDVWNPATQEFTRKPVTVAPKLVQVVGPDGQATWAPVSEAAGQRAYVRPSAVGTTTALPQDHKDLISRAIIEGRLDPTRVNSRNQAMIGNTLAMNPEADLLGLNLEAVSKGASARNLGTQLANVTVAANEAEQMIGIAQQYVDAMNPSDLPALNQAGQFVAKNTGDPNQAALAASLNSLVNVYARAINPRGVPTVSDKQHAREIINSYMSSGQFAAVFDVMKQEMQAAQKAPKEVRPKLLGNERASSGNIPQAAIDALKSGKGTDAQFDEIFGAGAAKRVRGR